MEPAQLDLKAGPPGAVPVDYVMAQRPRARNLASQSSLSFLCLLTFFRSCSQGIERIELKDRSNLSSSMVNVPGRSKGCSECRQRKQKVQSP